MMGKSLHAAVIVDRYIIYVCTAIQKFGISKIFNVVLKKTLMLIIKKQHYIVK